MTRREWRRQRFPKKRRHVKPSQAATPHRKRADEVLRYAKHRRARYGGISGGRSWVNTYYHFRRGQYRAESPGTWDAIKDTEIRAIREARRFNRLYCRPVLSHEAFEQAVTPDPKWYFRRNVDVAAWLGITDAEALVVGAESLTPDALWDLREREKRDAIEAQRHRRYERNQLIAQLIREGLGDTEVARRAGVHRTTAWRHRKRLQGLGRG